MPQSHFDMKYMYTHQIFRIWKISSAWIVHASFDGGGGGEKSTTCKYLENYWPECKTISKGKIMVYMWRENISTAAFGFSEFSSLKSSHTCGMRPSQLLRMHDTAALYNDYRWGREEELIYFLRWKEGKESRQFRPRVINVFESIRNLEERFRGFEPHPLSDVFFKR